MSLEGGREGGREGREGKGGEGRGGEGRGCKPASRSLIVRPGG